MKPSLIIMLMITTLLTSCNLDPGYAMYSDLVIPIDERNVPETGVTNQPVNIWVSTAADNGCWSDITFRIVQKDDREFEIWAAADFQSNGECPAAEVSADSTLTFTPTRTGNHIIVFWMSTTDNVRDTVVVSNAQGSR